MRPLPGQTKVAMLPSPQELKKQVPPSPQAWQHIQQARATHRALLSGQDPRRVFVLGPCSIHHLKAATDYAALLKELAEEVSDTCILVMRVYVEKSRSATGWKGFVYDPYLDGSGAIETGLIGTRKLLLTLAEQGVACATEFVDPLISGYIEDLISWGFIGARTSSSQPHRQLASSLNIPIGFKNSVDGNVEVAVQGILSAQQGQRYLSINEDGRVCAVQSKGNQNSHLVLRGSWKETNYDPLSIAKALRLLGQYHLPLRVMVDCAHGNAQKKEGNQRRVFESVLGQMCRGNAHLFGLMLESHLESGNQPLTGSPQQLRYGVSVTDPCLGWKETYELIKGAHLSLRSQCPLLQEG